MGAGSPLKREPHLPQKANPSGLAKPHDGQSKVSLAPQRPQNAMSGGVSNAQRGQIISGRARLETLHHTGRTDTWSFLARRSGFPPLRCGRLPLDRGQPIERVNQFLGLPGSGAPPELRQYDRRLTDDKGISDGGQGLLA